MENKPDLSRFMDLKFDDFRSLAATDGLSKYEKIGFPDSYRAGKEEAIYSDISAKMPVTLTSGATILDIGCGCSDLPRMLIDTAQTHEQTLILIDSAEMLALLPASNSEKIIKIAGRYPDIPDFFCTFGQKIDSILVYSVFQYIFTEGNMYSFLDKSLTLLAPGGRMLIGDIPNISMRKRFFSSEAGIACHCAFTGTNEIPDVLFNQIEDGHIDDAVVMGVCARARAAGFHSFILMQGEELPMANRREDVLIVRP
jgi:hypothetical protein